MAYTIGAYVKVSGEKEFCNAMKQLKEEMSYTKAESEALTSQYDKNDKSQEAVKARTDALKKALDLQQAAVDEAKAALDRMRERGLEPTDEAYRSMEKNLYKLQTQANKTQNEIKNIGDAAQESADDVESGGGNALQSFMSGDWSGLISQAGLATVSIAGIGTAAIEAAKGIYQLAKEAAGDADDILTNASIMGVDTATYQKLDYAANFVDVSVETMGKALDKIRKAQMQVNEDGQMFINDNMTLTVGYGDTMMDTLDIFYMVIDQLGAMDDEVQKDAVANELFGKSYRELVPLIEAGSDALKAYGDAAEEKGYIMTDEELSNLGAVNDQLDEMSVAMDAMKRAFISELLPAVKIVLDAILELINAISAAIDKSKEFAEHSNQYGMVGGNVGSDELASNYWSMS